MSFAFAAGGTLAKKISNQITQQTNKVKQSVHQYNHIFKHTTTKLPRQIELEDAYDVTSKLWQHLDESKPSVGTVPTYLKRQLVDMWHRVQRSREEKRSIHMEMGNCVHFYRTQKSKLCTLIGRLHSKNQYERGLECLLRARYAVINRKIDHLTNLFKECGLEVDDDRDADMEDVEGTEEGEVTRMQEESDRVGSEEDRIEEADQMGGETDSMEEDSDENEEEMEEIDDDGNDGTYEPLEELCTALLTYEDAVTSDDSDGEGASAES